MNRQEIAKKYARLRRRWMLFELVVSVLYCLAWLLAGWSVGLRSTLAEWTSNEWIKVATFGGIFGGGYYLLTLPIAFVSGFVLPLQFGLSNRSLLSWVIDQIKSGLISAVLGVGLLEMVYALLRYMPGTWWLWSGLALLFFTVLLANLAPVLIYPLFYKIAPLGDEYQELVDRLVLLARQAKAQVRGVYQMNMSRTTNTANAVLAGLGKTRRIILGDTLLSKFGFDEIETILAHELGHHVHRDIPVGILIESGLTLVGLYLASLGLNSGVWILGLQGIADVAAMPLFALVVGLYGFITMPISNAYSRWRERRADAYAVRLTGKGEALASALARLANQNLSDADPEPWVEWLLYSHPPLGKRIRAVLDTR